ncbi:MAG: hypothetical protein NTX45_00930 [Proteobacteria bacterium]|nr:hypothetical protein [Pseudomonadota bacterium]
MDFVGQGSTIKRGACNKATGQAKGILPLAVWLDGDLSHGQAGTMPSDRTG